MNFIRKISTFLIITLGTILVLYFILYFILYFTRDCEKNDMNLNITNICKEKSSQSNFERTLLNEKEVYHIDEQNLTYDQAIKKCEENMEQQ